MFDFGLKFIVSGSRTAEQAFFLRLLICQDGLPAALALRTVGMGSRFHRSDDGDSVAAPAFFSRTPEPSRDAARCPPADASQHKQVRLAAKNQRNADSVSHVDVPEFWVATPPLGSPTPSYVGKFRTAKIF